MIQRAALIRLLICGLKVRFLRGSLLSLHSPPREQRLRKLRRHVDPTALVRFRRRYGALHDVPLDWMNCSFQSISPTATRSTRRRACRYGARAGGALVRPRVFETTLKRLRSALGDQELIAPWSTPRLLTTFDGVAEVCWARARHHGDVSVTSSTRGTNDARGQTWTSWTRRVNWNGSSQPPRQSMAMFIFQTLRPLHCRCSARCHGAVAGLLGQDRR